MLWEEQRRLGGALCAELSPLPEEEALVGSCLGTEPQLPCVYLFLLLW